VIVSALDFHGVIKLPRTANWFGKQGFIDPHEDVLVINTGTGLKYGESLQGSVPIRLEKGTPLPRLERLLAG